MPRVAVCSVKNGRKYMEDRFVVCKNVAPDTHLMAVFDGHGGYQVADISSVVIPKLIKSRLYDQGKELNSFLMQAEVLSTSIAEADEKMSQIMKSADLDPTFINLLSQCGSTACIALMKSNNLTVANLGDSRALLLTDFIGDLQQLSVDHKPGADQERLRIESLGGFVANIFGTERVMGNLSLSRALGDWYERPFISQYPEIMHVTLEKKHTALVIASDGLWDVMSNIDVQRIIHREVSSPKDKNKNVSRALVEEAIKRQSMDNITVIYINLNDLSAE